MKRIRRREFLLQSLAAVALSALGCTLVRGAPVHTGNAVQLARPLNREERLILVLYYYEEMTPAEIGAALNLSESRVTRIHGQVLQRLRQRCGGLRSRGRFARDLQRVRPA